MKSIKITILVLKTLFGMYLFTLSINQSNSCTSIPLSILIYKNPILYYSKYNNDG